MGTTSSKKNPTSKVNPAVVEPVGDELVPKVNPAVVKPAVVDLEKWYKEKENKEVVIGKIDEISLKNAIVKLKDGLALKLVSAGESAILRIINNSNEDKFQIGIAHPDGPDDTRYKKEFKNKIEADMKTQNGGKKKTSSNQKTKKTKQDPRRNIRNKQTKLTKKT